MARPLQGAQCRLLDGQAWDQTPGGTGAMVETPFPLGLVLRDLGEMESALALLRRCFDGRRKALGENHPDTLATAESLKRLEAQSATYATIEN
jgi:hypothetical protein